MYTHTTLYFYCANLSEIAKEEVGGGAVVVQIIIVHGPLCVATSGVVTLNLWAVHLYLKYAHFV